MKKICSLVLALCTCCAALLLTACNDDHAFATDWSCDDTHHWHSCTDANCTEVSEKAEHTWNAGEITTAATANAKGVKTFTCTTCAKTRTEAVDYVPTPTVTAEAWADALNVDDVNFIYTQTSSDTSVLPTVTVTKTETAARTHILGGTTEQDSIVSIEDNAYYRYECTNSTWTKNTCNTDNLAYDYGETCLLASLFPVADFTYDEATKSYKAATTGTSHMVITDATLKFEDGKLTHATLTTNGVQISITVTYGNAAITLPSISA